MESKPKKKKGRTSLNWIEKKSQVMFMVENKHIDKIQGDTPEEKIDNLKVLLDEFVKSL